MVVTDMRQEFLSRTQAAKRLGLSGERVTQLARSGVLECVRTPMGRIYSREVIEDFRRQRKELQRDK